MKRFISILLILRGAILVASAADTLEIADLKPSWIYQAGDEWYPATSDTRTRSLGFFLDLRDQQDLFLVIESNDEVAVWLNGQLHDQSTRRWIMSFSALIEIVKEERVFITVVSDVGFEHVATRLVEIGQSGSESAITLSKRKGQSFKNSFVLTLLAIVFFLGIFRRYFSIKFSQIIRWRPRLRKIDIDENFSGLVNLDNLVVISLSSAISAICWVYYRFQTGQFDGNFSEFLLLFFNAYLVTTLFLVFKVIFMRLIGKAFGFRGVSGIHTLEFLHYFSLILWALLVFVVVDFAISNSSHELVNFGFGLFLPLVILFFQIWVYFRLNRILPNTKILIFSYLCISEFLPAFLLLVWIVR